MTDLTTEAGPRDVSARRDGWPRLPWRRRHDPWAVLIVYIVARVFSAVVFVGAARTQLTAHPSWELTARPDYWSFVARMWDASWYEQIAMHGYPAEVPVGADGLATQNAWAFFPLFPLICKPFLALGLPWNAVAPMVSLVLGGAAMLLIYDVVRRSAHEGGRWIALGTVLLTSVFPAAAVLQTAYTESLALLLIAAALALLVRRRYWWCLPVVVLLGLTRAVALPFACVVAVHAIVRWRAIRREGGRLPVRDVVALAVLTIVSVLSGFLWQIVMGVVTGDPAAYVQTQMAWRWFDTVVPGLSWARMADLVLGWPGIVLVAALLALAGWTVVGRRFRIVGPELRAWAGFYLLFLVGVAEPQTSIARFLLLAFPFGAIAVSLSRSRAYLAALAIGSLLLQIAWVVMLWLLNAPSGYPP